jgi:amino acid transporter
MPKNNTRNGLQRRLGLFPVTNIVIANMIGAGIFTTSGLLMQDLHNPLLMIVLWIVAGVIALCGALCYGEVGAAIPRAGGEYTFLSRLFHPSLGFLSGWLSIFAGFSAPIAFSAMGSSEYLTRALPGLLRLGLLEPDFEALVLKKFYAIVVIAIFTLIHMRGIVFGSRVQNFLTILKVAVIVGLIVFGFASGKGDTAHFTSSGFDLGFSGWKVIGLSLMSSFDMVISILISFALFSSLSAFIILGPRVYYSMAKDGLFFKFASQVHPVHQVPYKSILLQGIVASVLVLLGTFEQILTYMGFSLGIFPILVVLGVFKLRRLGTGSYRMPGYPLVPIVYVIFGITILILAFLQSPLISAIALGTTALGIPAYFVFKQRYKENETTP